ncbi:MAG TPA: cyclic nucleotide-binding domain-containing protein [Vicinamibacterales bacterium]|nr:cyclic nucleotide-binding domain-containing protein [Vicinamibacterales bacterium]
MSQPELLRGLPQDAADRVLALGTVVVLPKEAVLFRLGEPADRLFIVTRGKISLTLPLQVLGREENVLIEERGPGQAISWSALIPPHRLTLTATAATDAEVLALPRETLLEHFEKEPVVGYAVARHAVAVAGQRLQVFQAMWLREMQRLVQLKARAIRESA